MNKFKAQLHLLALLVLLPAFTFAHAPAAPVQSEFEELARRSDTQVTWSAVTTETTSGAARFVITALEIKAADAPGERTRGLRIDLSDQTASESVYIEEPYAQRVRNLIKKLDEDLRRWGMNPEVRSQCLGVYELHASEPRYYSLTADYCVRSDFSGLSLTTLRGHAFELQGAQPTFLINALDAALAALAQRGQVSQ